jgi:hypothetical protein
LEYADRVVCRTTSKLERAILTTLYFAGAENTDKISLNKLNSGARKVGYAKITESEMCGEQRAYSLEP